VDWQLTDENLISFNATRGFKPGGASLDTLCATRRDCEPYAAELVWAYELTSKNDFFDRRARVNLTLFWADYDPYQACFITDFTTFFCNTEGRATVRGIELETIARPISELELIFNMSFLDTRIDDAKLRDHTEPFFLPSGARNPARKTQDLSGNRLPRAPKWTFHIGAQYDFDTTFLGLGDWGTITPRIDYKYRTRTFYRVFNDIEFSQAAYSWVDLRLSWQSPSGRWTWEGFVSNVTDVDVINTIVVAPSTSNALTFAQLLEPRTAGIRIGWSF
jgi:iron complex outermembrane receptor protein